MVAARAGANFVAPYVNRLDNVAGDGTGVVKKIVDTFAEHNLETRVLAASFRNVEQIQKCCEYGSQAVTAKPELITKLIGHPLTEAAVEQFISDWEAAYGGARLFEE